VTYRLFYVSNYLMDKYNKDIIAINDVGADSKVFHPLMSKLMWMKDLLPLASFK